MKASVFGSAALLSIALTLLSACGGDGGNRDAIPRRKAYPRLQIPDSTFHSPDSLPYALQINEAATARLKRRDADGVWVDVAYPGLNAVVYYTFTTVAPSEADEALRNRSERIALNLGGREAEMLSFSSPDSLFCEVVVDNQSAGATPVQFLATDHKGLVVSGAAHIGGEMLSADSVAPIVDMLRRDIIHSLKTLRP